MMDPPPRGPYLEDNSNSGPRECCVCWVILDHGVADFSKLLDAIGYFTHNITKVNGLAILARYLPLFVDHVLLTFLDHVKELL